MGLGALFTIADIVSSNLREQKLEKLLRAKGLDERNIKDVKGALSYVGLSERDRASIYKNNPGLDRKKAENRFMVILFYIFQDLEIAEFVIGNRKKALQANNEAKAFFAEIENQKNEKALTFSQVEARVVRFSIINYVDRFTMSDDERNQLKEIADFIKIRTDPISSHGNINLNVSDDMLVSLQSLLYAFLSDSEMALVYGSIGPDNFIGDTGVRLSEMAPYIPIMKGLIERFSKQIE